jgi:hypothetical protein
MRAVCAILPAVKSRTGGRTDAHERRDGLLNIEWQDTMPAMNEISTPQNMHWKRFLVLARDRVRNGNLPWKNTMLLGAGELPTFW